MNLFGDLYGRIGVSATASFTPAAATYSSGTIMSVAQEFVWKFNDGSTIQPGALIRVSTAILKIDQTALQSGEGAYTLRSYDVTPPSAQADQAAWTLVSGDLSSYRGPISLGTPVDEGSCCYIKTTGMLEDIKLLAGKTSHFGELQTVAGFTATAVARQVFLHGFLL